MAILLIAGIVIIIIVVIIWVSNDPNKKDK